MTAALAGFSVARLVAAAKLPPAQDAEQAARQGRATGIWFGIIFATEAIFIAAAAILLAGAGRPLLIPVVVAAIVGVHFWPLARVFRIPIYWGTGALLLCCAAASLLIGDENARLLALGIAVALVLWISAAVVLVTSTAEAR